MHRLGRIGAVVLAVCALTIAAGTASAAPIELKVIGSTSLDPLVKLWIPDYTASHPGVTITSVPAGSGAGVEAVISGTAQIGLSDAYLSDEQAEQNPQLINLPLAISARTINYNIPEIGKQTLKLDGPAIAGIYSGNIREWDSAEIKALNPGEALPHRTIVPIRREDASGATFIFSQFLEFSTPSWGDKVRSGMSIAWPNVPGEKAAVGNGGELEILAATPYGIAYIGISWEGDVTKAGLGTAMVKNQAGEFLLPTSETISAAASELDARTPPDERLTLVFAPGPNSYPLIAYEYAVVSTRQRDPAVAAAIREFLKWAASPTGGHAAKYLDQVHFVELPLFLRAMNEKQIAQIK
ncbi:MAG TPA: phosphate ABC transporter substrate-binding protein PstS [Candidatus Binataceae bacterium]|nr:phosphate ABC transporter substrate-binding protein PstS [Candidatus Binataceae bacterium]